MLRVSDTVKMYFASYSNLHLLLVNLVLFGSIFYFKSYHLNQPFLRRVVCVHFHVCVYMCVEVRGDVECLSHPPPYSLSLSPNPSSLIQLAWQTSKLQASWSLPPQHWDFRFAQGSCGQSKHFTNYTITLAPHTVAQAGFELPTSPTAQSPQPLTLAQAGSELPTSPTAQSPQLLTVAQSGFELPSSPSSFSLLNNRIIKLF